MASTTTSSSSAPARAAARSRTASRPRASASCCSSAAATCRASPRTGTRTEVFGQRPLRLRASAGTTRHGAPFRPHAQYFVGGNTKVYGAILFRLRERDFGEVRHYGGISPAWPLSYADLEPYYAEAERLYLVHGAGGRGSDRAAALRPVPVPGGLARAAHPAAPRRPRSAGHQPFHLPVGVDLDESDPEAGRCVRCDRFDGFPCLTDGKADAHVLCVRPALKHPNVTLLTHAQGRAPGDRRVRPLGEPRRRRPPRRARRHTAPTSSSCRAAPSTRRRCCCARRRPPPQRARELAPTWSAATTWPTSTRA